MQDPEAMNESDQPQGRTTNQNTNTGGTAMQEETSTNRDEGVRGEWESGNEPEPQEEQRAEEDQEAPEDSWDHFRQQFRGVGNLRKARALRDLRDQAQAKIPALESEKAELEAERDALEDPLDQLAKDEEIDEVEEKITFCKRKLETIARSAEKALKDAKAEDEATAEETPSAEADADTQEDDPTADAADQT